MGWFWADPNAPDAVVSSKCPVNHKAFSAAPAGACPVDHKAFASSGDGCPVKRTSKAADEDKGAPAVCPVNHKGTGGTAVNPLNNMPEFIPSARQPGQKLELPTQRTISTIPRGEKDDEGYWEYPSPQQMFNAMVRKGKGDGIPEDAVESMVDVHNFLNEGAWQEILDWEKPYTERVHSEPRLLKFTGRPDDMSPRARMYLYLSKVFPNSFAGNPPFDRHDWTVLRNAGKGANGAPVWKQVRYVIDYYGGPDADDVPSFFLDVRPALDDPQNALDRLKRWGGPFIKKALGKDDAATSVKIAEE